MDFSRKILPKIEENLFKKGSKKPAIIIYGPRQVGKTTLCQQIQKKFSENTAFYNCDYFDIQEQFAYKNAKNLKNIVGKTKLLILDEAQRIKNIGLTIKILVDEFPNLQVIATGSSSFDLANEINEPLTGRKIEFKLFPLAYSEINEKKDFLTRQQTIENLLRFGNYPLIIEKTDDEAENYLKELTGSYLFKDILAFQNLRKPEMLSKLLKLLAFQIGQEVSFHELATQLGIDTSVVQKYIHLLEESFVIVRLGALSRNLRKEVSKTRKIYFWDLGIRNTIIQNLNPMDLRTDTGALWENFCIMERLKYLEYERINCNQYFWRTYTQKEIDYIEEKGGILNAYEFKWNTTKKTKIPKEFLETYQNSTYTIITKQNIDDFLDTKTKFDYEKR